MTLKGVLELLDRHPGHRGKVDSWGGNAGESGVTVRQGAPAAFLASRWSLQQGPVWSGTPVPEPARRHPGEGVA